MKTAAWPRRAASFLVFTLLVHPPAYAAMIGHWSFDGCTTTDATIPASPLTPHNVPTCVVGRFGDAWQLNGTNQYLERGFDPDFVPGLRSWTVAAWVRTGNSSNYQIVVSWYRCGANPACSGPDASYYQLAVDHGRPDWEVRDDAASAFSLQDSTVSIADNNWHLLVGTMNAGTDSVKLYVDGILRKARSGPLGTLTNGSVSIPLEVGRLFRVGWGVPDSYLEGSIDGVRIYDQELSVPEIAQLFASNPTGVGPVSGTDADVLRLGANPVQDGRLTASFILPGVEPADLELFDVAGRRVARLANLHGSAHQQVEIGRNLTAGVYLVRLSQGGHSYEQRVTVLN